MFKLFRPVLLLLLLISTMSANAARWQEITQPIGNLIRVWGKSTPPPVPLQPPSRIPPFTAPSTGLEEVNYICAQWDTNITPQTIPFDLHTSVTETVLTQPQHFVRVYAPASGSSPNGVWLMRSEFARGLTPEQIKDRFALPTVPTHIVNVDLPASPDPTTGKDFALWTGVAGPIAGFGNGGGVQNRIIADFNGTNYFPNYQFVIGTRDHPQLIGEFALSYQPMAGTGNTQHIAAYLDQFIPKAYSDLENVYTVLDFLNWPDFGPDPIRQALNQIGPQDYNAVPFVIARNALLFGTAVLERCRFLHACNQSMDCCEDTCFTIQGVGEYMNEHKQQQQAGFHDWTGGAVGTIDFQPCKNVLMGVSITGMDNYLKWHEDRGSAHIATAKLGLYASYTPIFSCLSNCYLDGLITGGYNWTKTNRHISFPGVDRDAHSKQKGYDIAVHAQGGCDLPINCWQISPLVRLSYFYVRENSFTEKGADSLDLKVNHFDAQTLRTNVGVGVARTFDVACVEVTPQVYVAWIHDFFLDHRKISAHLCDLDGSFDVHGFNRDRNGFLGTASLALRHPNGLVTEGTYEAELENHFVSHRLKLCLNWCF